MAQTNRKQNDLGNPCHFNEKNNQITLECDVAEVGQSDVSSDILVGYINCDHK